MEDQSLAAHPRPRAAGHVTVGDTGTLENISRTGRPNQIEFVYEDPSADSLEFEEPIRFYPCRLPGCNVRCRRPYDLDRHHQTKHQQSQHWFCPVDSCKLSCAVAGLTKLNLWSLVEHSFNKLRHPLTSKVLHVSEDGGHATLELNGFTRKDKLTKHLKKVHKEVFLQLGGTPYGRELARSQPLRCDLQSYWGYAKPNIPRRRRPWVARTLSRLQMDDGTWSAYVGPHLDAVAEADFRCWTKDDDESFKRLGQDPRFIDVVPWQAHDLILKLGSDAPMLKMNPLQEYQMQLMLLEQQNKKRLIMARQEGKALLQQSHDTPPGLSTAETQNSFNGGGAAGSVSGQLALVSESLPVPCLENIEHNPSVSSGFESTPGSYENTQDDAMPDCVAVEAAFAEFNWDAFLADLDLNFALDSLNLAHNDGENMAFDYNDPAFDFNNLAIDSENPGFNFNDSTSVPDWYFDCGDAAEPEL